MAEVANPPLPQRSDDAPRAAPQPDVSIVIPGWNEAAYIEGALDSVRSQRWPRDRVEVSVVANACTDDTAGVVRAYVARHPDLPVRLVELAQAGVGNARNEGARRASAPLLIFMDADSRMTPYVVARAIRLDQLGVVAATYRFLADSDDRVDRAFFWWIELLLLLLLQGVRTFNFYCRPDAFLAHGGFDPRILVAEVIDLFGRFAARGITVGHVPTVIRTSPRRLHRGPLRIGLLATTARWTLASWGIGRLWPY